MFKKIASILILLGASLTTNANYIYEANQSLFDLTNQTGTTNMAVGDDQVSAAFNLDFTFTFYGEDFTSARMATNGCLHFGSSGSYCNDYTPDPLPEITYTLYPFWTDLIRDNGSKVLAKNFTDKSVFGWYNLREYNRSNTDNSFEVILWKSDDSFEFRYGALNIINHDVLIGEQGKSDELYTYYYHDQCGKGTTNSSSCVNQTWNASTMNTTLENGGSLYGLGTGNSIDCSNPLNDSSCAGYDAAYLTQQCNINSLYDTSCPLYWEAYDDLQCDLDPQYAPFCAGYTQEESVAYYVEDETDYGYVEEEYDYGYEEEYDYSYEEELYYETDSYYEEEIYFSEQIEQEVYEEYINFYEEEYENEEVFTAIEEEEYYIPFESVEEELPILLEEEYIDFVVDIFEQDTPDPIFLEEVLFEEFERREIIIEEEYMEEEPVEYLEFETIEELEEWFEEEEEIEEEIEEEVEEIEEEAEETRVAEEEKGGITSQMLSVVASTIQTATDSVSGTTAGTSIHATGNTKSSGGSVAGNTTATAVTSSVTGGQSMSNSPSISAQVVSSVVQTQQVLNSFSTDSSVSNTMSTQNTAVGNTDSGSNTAVGSTTTTTNETATNTSVASNTSSDNNTAVGNTGGEENTAVGETSGPQNTAVAFENNMQDQQEQLEQQQEETGEYADSTQLVAYMGTVPGFDAYRQIVMPQASAWYEPKDIYMSALMPDNNQAFFGMYSDSLNGLKALQDLQPNL
jgi:hypothetical protein